MRYPDIAVYAASKLRHAEKLRKALNHDGIYSTASWLRNSQIGAEATRPVNHWQNDNFADIRRSDCVLAYVEIGEHMKGGLIEIGYAIAYQKPVFLVTGAVPWGADDNTDAVAGHPDFSHWQHLDICQRKFQLEAAIQAIKVKFHPPEQRMDVKGLTPTQEAHVKRLIASEKKEG